MSTYTITKPSRIITITVDGRKVTEHTTLITTDMFNGGQMETSHSYRSNRAAETEAQRRARFLHDMGK